MTCFWDGIILSLDIKDFQKLNINIKPSPTEFVERLKKYNTKTNNVSWCNNEISVKQIDENYEAVQNYDINHINTGYYCSTFDPFLFLISELFNLEIYHKYLNNTITYKNNNSIKIVEYYSNSYHFTFVKSIKIKD